MNKARRIITVGGTLCCALGIGYLMQGNALLSSFSPAQAASAVQAEVQTDTGAEQPLEISRIVQTSAIPVLPLAALQPEILPNKPIVLAALNDAPIAKMPEEEPAPSFSCDYTLTATPGAAAMVMLELSVPCMINERFTVHHNGMMFTEVTNDKGNSTLNVPALSEQSVFIVSFANGKGAVASAEVTSLEYYDRVVVQWTGESGLQIHAMEYGATYGDAGHVWAGSARDVASAVIGEGGFIAQYGAADVGEALRAEVYTFPSGTTSREGDVLLSVEAEVNNANCGRDIEAQTIQISAGNSLKVRDILLAMPECNTIGDFLVLKNLLNDLKIARN